jgi:hypothetical protein
VEKNIRNQALIFSERDTVKPWGKAASVINMALPAVALVATPTVVHFIHRQRKRTKILPGFLPVCSSRKNIRTDEGALVQRESHITCHSQAIITHTLCQERTERNTIGYRAGIAPERCGCHPPVSP